MSKVIKLNCIVETPDDLMTVKQCAESAQCSKDYIYDLINAGRLKEYKRGYKKVSYSEALRVMEG